MRVCGEVSFVGVCGAWVWAMDGVRQGGNVGLSNWSTNWMRADEVDCLAREWDVGRSLRQGRQDAHKTTEQMCE